MELLASDMDGTLVPPVPDPAWFAARRRFRALVRGRPALRLAYVTGRDLALALRGVREFGLPPPHALVCDVGTSVYVRRGGSYRLDAAYRNRMRRWLGPGVMEAVRRALRGAPGVVAQEAGRQAEFKLSYYLAPGGDARRTLRVLRLRLARMGLRASLVFSVDPAAGRGMLDILPRGAAKDSAVRHLAARLRVEPGRVLFAGDSGNDLCAFLAGFRAIVVSNAPAAVKAEVRRAARRDPLRHAAVYFASRPCLPGVLEGCAHFGLHLRGTN